MSYSTSRRVFRWAIGVATAVSVGVVATVYASDEAASAQNVVFAGQRLVVLSDADMVPSAYVDGNLGPVAGEDALSVIDLPNVTGTKVQTAPASNSVAGPPSALAVSPDGNFAYVVETLGPRPPGGEVFDDLPIGSRLTAFDITGGQPRLVQSIDIGRRPLSVAVSPSGDMLAVALHPADGRQLALVPIRDGVMGAATYVGAPGVPREAEAPHVDWHPSGNYLALTVLGGVDQVVFFAVDRQPALSVRPHGRPITVDKYPMMGRFTADGRWFINVNLFWGPDVDGFWVGAPPGTVTVTRFVEGPNPAEAQQVVSRASTAVSPEGMSISPNGRYIVTANLERSYVPLDDPRLTRYSSMTLLDFDTATGRVRSLADTRVEGILPEAAVFDASNQYVAAVIADSFPGDTPVGGSVKFFRLDEAATPNPRLVATDTAVPVVRGPHSMVLVP